jgi:asparagine synthase (glutamine-hydrolysing)
VGFAHRRLTVIDLTDASAQPMVDDDSGHALIYNGELYNYIELREELRARGRSFETTGDTEVVLRAYQEWGPRCVERFVGMWAFAVLDSARQAVVLSRDRFGIKPLFWTTAHDQFVFASEIKALLKLPWVDRGPDETTVANFLVRGVTETSTRSFFAGIRSLPPAHNLVVDLRRIGTPRPERYWGLPESPELSDEDAASGFATRFSEAIRTHVRSDVAVGTCLSGGLDSTAIVCVAHSLQSKGQLPEQYTHETFGYVPPGRDWSERHWMDLVVAQTGVRLTEVRPTRSEFEAALLPVVATQDEPFGSASIVAQWCVFDAARRAGVTVMLDGQGADEVLGGYQSYLVTIAAALLHARQRVAYARTHFAYTRRFRSSPVPVRSIAAAFAPRSLKTLIRALRPNGTAELTMGSRHPLLTPAVIDAVPDEPPLPTDVHSLLRQQTERGNLPALLRFEDRNSMSHSIEARVPFLDHRLVEYAFRLPPDAKIRGAETKRVLREAMRDVIPEPIRQRRDKIGFRADPAASTRFADAHRAALVENRTDAEAEWFRPKAINGLIDDALKDHAREFELWRAVNVKLWARLHWGDGCPT